MIRHITLALILLSTGLTCFSQAKVSSSFGKGINIMPEDSSFSMKINVRMQSLFVTTIPTDLEEATDIETNFLVRRSRLKFGGFAFSPKLKYKIELGLSNRDIGGVVPQRGGTANIILDAFVRWNAFGNVEIWAGQTKLPGNRERVISSQKLQFVDRSLVNSRFNIDRDMGIQLRNHFNVGNSIFRQALAFSQGEGRNVTVGNDNGGYQYTGRLEWLPFGKFSKKGDYVSSAIVREDAPKLSIGVTYDYNNLTTRDRGNNGSFVPDSTATDLTSIQADLMFKYKGLSVHSEYITKDAARPVHFDPEGEIVANFYAGWGFNIQAGWMFENNLEIAARYTTIEPNIESGRDLQDMYTLGLSRYFSGHDLKIQTDISYLEETEQIGGASAGEIIYRFQFEVAF